MRHIVFGRTGLRISTIALGSANFGTAWGYGSSPEEARAVFDGYRAAGGNFIDTADFYQMGEAESLLGGFIASVRDEIVLGTKFTLSAASASALPAIGNSRKAMCQSVAGSLKRLRTDRIDVFWVHMPDGVTPMEEILQGLDALTRAGKILYAGLCNFPAWRIAAGATLAQLQGWTPISALQVEYSLVERTAEREHLPMAAGFGIGTLGYSPLGTGWLSGKYRRGEIGRAQKFGDVMQGETDARKTAILDAVIAIASEMGATPGQVAIAWVLGKGIIPIIGPRTAAQLADNLASTALVLSGEQVARLDEVSAVPLGFPHETLATPPMRAALAGGHPELVERYPLKDRYPDALI